MERVGRSAVEFVGAESAEMRKEVLVAESVVGEVKRRVSGSRGGHPKAKAEKEKDEKLEKARAAAWAWYEHAQGGGESTSRSRTSATGASKFVGRSVELEHKSSRFKIEAVKTGGHSVSPPAELCHRRTESGRGWDTSIASMSGASSLFDSYELGYVSKRIETAVKGCKTVSRTPTTGRTALPPGFHIVHQGQGPTVGRPPHKQRPGVSSARFVPQVITIPDGSHVSTRSPKMTRSSSIRLQCPRYICSSLYDVVTHEEMPLGVDIAKRDCQKTKATLSDGSGWSLRRSSRVHSLPRL